MGQIIQVPYTELYSRANTIRQQADAIDQEIRSLEQTVASLDWMGDRAQHFRAMWANAKPEMKSWARTVRMFADDLQSQARRMEIADHNG